MTDIWEVLRIFFKSTWLENHLFYFFLLGVLVSFILITILLLKTRKQIKKLDKEKRKRDKEILKFLSNKKNKTY
jgi:cell division protein FtsL